MPQRDERLFWLHARQVDGAIARMIDAENHQFAGAWTACALGCTPCVRTQVTSDRLWLFRLGTTNQALASKFNKQLTAHIKGLPLAIGTPNLCAKRQTHLPQPLVIQRLGPWPKTDLGLHSVNDKYNGTLISYSYYEGKYYRPPHLQLSDLNGLCLALKRAWDDVACCCHLTIPSCCGVGCYDCFQAQCPRCDGTGWKDFAKWVGNGCQVDYSSGVPIAKLQGESQSSEGGKPNVKYQLQAPNSRPTLRASNVDPLDGLARWASM